MLELRRYVFIRRAEIMDVFQRPRSYLQNRRHREGSHHFIDQPINQSIYKPTNHPLTKQPTNPTYNHKKLTNEKRLTNQRTDQNLPTMNQLTNRNHPRRPLAAL